MQSRNGEPDRSLAHLAEGIAALDPDRRIRVAIDGVDGAGKTMLADVLAPETYLCYAKA